MNRDNDTQMTAQPAAAPVAEKDPVFAKPRKPRAAAAGTTARTEPEKPEIFIPLGDPGLHARLKPVLNRGAKMELAAQGFKDSEQFATVAHAARNTEVPFVVLKQRVLEQGQSLADAIRESKPDVDAKAEAERARAEARADLDTLGSN